MPTLPTMNSEPRETRHAPPAPGRPSRSEGLALAAILLLSALLQLVNLGQQGMGNPYYAATVRSMLVNPRNFFFASFDPGGWVSVDKPPLGFWVQSLFAAVLGYRGFALLLPQALATVAACAMAWLIARRAFGPPAGLIAALVLALTPISVAAGRTNTIDPLLVLTLLVAAWALLRAIERGSFGWLIASAALIGLGFNIKMLQAWLILPAWGIAWLVGSGWRVDRRIGAIAAAGAVVILVSFSWMVAVEDVPADQRPYIGSSSTNSAFDLAFGYNGLQRLLPPSLTGIDDPGAGSMRPPSPGTILSTFGAIETGPRGPFRLFNHYLAAQIAWLLPMAAFGAIVAWTREGPAFAWPLSRSRAALLFFGGWLVTGYAFFSVANQFHRYYLIMLATPIAVLTGAGLVAMGHDWRAGGRRGWLLPGAIVGTGFLALAIAAPFEGLARSFGVAAGIVAAAAGILLGMFRHRLARTGLQAAPDGGESPATPRPSGVSLAAAALAFIAMLAGPAFWSAWSVAFPVSNALPAAGPNGDLLASFAAPLPQARSAGEQAPPAKGRPSGIDSYQPPDPALVAFLERNHAGERFMLATASAMSASPLIIDRAMPVAALGGFVGQDPIVTPRGLAAMIGRGELRYVLAPDPRKVNLLSGMAGIWGALKGTDSRPSGQEEQSPDGALAPDPTMFLQMFMTPNVRWVAENCRPVPPVEWQTPGRPAGNPLAGLEALYDCTP